MIRPLVSRSLQSSAVNVFPLDSPFTFANICFMYLDSSVLGVYIFIELLYFLIKFIPFSLCYVFFLSHYRFVLKSVLSDKI